MRILPPDRSSKRARFADWLELLALTSVRGQTSLANLRGVLRFENDDRTPASDLDGGSDDTGEPEITNQFAEDLEERVVEELEFRASKIGSAYPFELVVDAGVYGGTLRCKTGHLDPREGRLFYVFCLLDSLIREKLITVPAEERGIVDRIGAIFQVCACLAVGGYLGVEVVSFGFPRATGDAFLPAFKRVWQRYGSFNVINKIPHGFDDKLKDGGVDIVAWRHFRDRYAGTILMFVQVASGLNWKDKPVAEDVRQIRKWFEGASFENFVPAICIPFPLWFDLPEPSRSPSGEVANFYDGVHARFLYREGKFGIIFDRGRIAQTCSQALMYDHELSPHIDGIGLIDDVEQWVREVMESLVERRAAA